MIIRLHAMVMHTKVLGPGTRTAIWFQGCDRNCKGCMSPLSRPMTGGVAIKVDDVINAIIDEKNAIEGVTISGGEPFLQIDGLHYLLNRIRDETHLGVIIYTGFTLEQLKKIGSARINDIISGLADLIIDGEYIDELNDGIALRGSSNQRFVHITDRYVKEFEAMEVNHRNAEVLAKENELFFIGIPSKKTLDDWEKTIKMIAD